MKKRLKLLSASLVLAICLTNTAAFAASFPDVPDNTVNNGAVEYLKQKSIISGYPDGTFQPAKTINRAEALKIVMLALDVQKGNTAGQTQEPASATRELAVSDVSGQEVTKEISFPDVTTADWFYQYVKRAYSLGIIEGYPDGSFKPASNINVAESIKIIETTFDAQVPENLAASPYPDVDKSAWYAPYAQYAKTRQLIWTQEDGSLHADRDITRAEFAQIIYRLLYISDKKLEVFPLSTDWPAFSHPSDHYSLKYPFGWQKIAAGSQTVFWKQDTANRQISFARVYPNSATAIIARDENAQGLSLDDYLGRIKYDQSAEIKKSTLNNYPFAAVSISTQGVSDYYWQFPDKSILVIYSQLGTGLNRPQLADELKYLVESVNYVAAGGAAPVDPAQEFLSKVRKNILAADKGQETLDLFTDLSLIETDTIGIGTGPVDYYYSPAYDLTLKYERNSNIILDLQETKTTAF